MTSLSRRHNPLNAKQLHILQLIYKFRFMTAPLLAQYKNLKSRHSMYMTLELLAEQNYLAKRVDNNIAFQNKGARYFLTTEALKILRDNQALNKHALHAMYKNETVAEVFVDHHIETIRYYLVLRDIYPDKFHIFTRSELFDYTELPSEPRPDLYLNSITPKGRNAKEYILYIFTDKRPIVIKRMFDDIVEHFDSDEWDEEGEGTDYPTILMVCADSRVEDSLQQYIVTKLDNTGIDDLEVLTTTAKGLLNSNKTDRAVWSNVLEPEILIDLAR